MKSNYTVYADLRQWVKDFPDAPNFIVCRRGKGLIDQYETLDEMRKKYPDIKLWEEPPIDFSDQLPRNYSFAKYLHWETDESSAMDYMN